MECRQHIGDRNVFGCIGCKVIDKIRYSVDKRVEDAEHPDNPEKVEYEMGKCRPSCLCITGESRDIGGYCRTDILSHHQRNTQIQV